MTGGDANAGGGIDFLADNREWRDQGVINASRHCQRVLNASDVRYQHGEFVSAQPP